MRLPGGGSSRKPARVGLRGQEGEEQSHRRDHPTGRECDLHPGADMLSGPQCQDGSVDSQESKSGCRKRDAPAQEARTDDRIGKANLDTLACYSPIAKGLRSSPSEAGDLEPDIEMEVPERLARPDANRRVAEEGDSEARA